MYKMLNEKATRRSTLRKKGINEGSRYTHVVDFYAAFSKVEADGFDKNYQSVTLVGSKAGDSKFLAIQIGQIKSDTASQS